jgi:hypothetical protein
MRVISRGEERRVGSAFGRLGQPMDIAIAKTRRAIIVSIRLVEREWWALQSRLM